MIFLSHSYFHDPFFMFVSLWQCSKLIQRCYLSWFKWKRRTLGLVFTCAYFHTYTKYAKLGIFCPCIDPNLWICMNHWQNQSIKEKKRNWNYITCNPQELWNLSLQTLMNVNLLHLKLICSIYCSYQGFIYELIIGFATGKRYWILKLIDNTEEF